MRHLARGGMAERLGSGLQIRLQRFNSASHLQFMKNMTIVILAAILVSCASIAARADCGGYTNHAGNVISGCPVKLTMHDVVLAVPPAKNGETYPLSIFPESEQRRIAADFGTPRVPPTVKRTVDGAKKAMARSRKRAEKGLCTKEESDAFCAKSEAALKGYLDRQVRSGVLTPAERQLLMRQ